MSNPTTIETPPLQVEDLVVDYHTRRGVVRAVNGVSFTLAKGERLGLVGESGSGKSTLALSLMAAHKEPAQIAGGRVLVNGTDILGRSPQQVREMRLAKISMIPQGALNSLNPVMRVRHQIVDGLRAHGLELKSREYEPLIGDLLQSVGLQPAVADMYPHELSGGMKQRVVIAISVSLHPSVIIADEPTSALDVVVQRQIVQTIQKVQEEIGAATILIGHDMGLIAQFADRIGIMYAGKLVEIGPVETLFEDPQHPYSRLLISSLPDTLRKHRMEGIPGMTPSLLAPPPGCMFHPRCPQILDICPQVAPQLQVLSDGHLVSCHLHHEPQRPTTAVTDASFSGDDPEPAEAATGKGRISAGGAAAAGPERWTPDVMSSAPRSGGDSQTTPLLEARDLNMVFIRGTIRKRSTVALDRISLSIPDAPPTITAIVGESGSGKTTLANLMMGLLTPTGGTVYYQGKALREMDKEERRQFRLEVQTIFQDPFEAYNPFYKVDHVLTTPIKKYGLVRSDREAHAMVVNALEEVGLRPDETLGRYPHQLSGGQRQRIMVARALMLKPKIIIADEPVSMVDASLRATILESLRELNQVHGISILYITHDPPTAYQIADNIVVLYQGRVAESGDIEHVIHDPQHPYTQLLVDSIPQPNPKTRWGEPTAVLQSRAAPPATGCNFYDRCGVALDSCTAARPSLYRTDQHRVTRCFRYDEAPEVGDIDLSKVFLPPRASEYGRQR
jgi:peptide/nickel transport system ATP-binding protein